MSSARILPLRGTIYSEARKAALSAGADWPRLLGAAQTLSQSPDWTDVRLARHIREAHSLHLAGLLKPVDPRHRDRADLIDLWKASALAAAAEETPVRIALREARRGTIRAALVDMAALLAFGAAVLVVVYVGGPM